MIARKVMTAKTKKKVHFENNDEIIFSIKRKIGEEPPETIYLSNEEEMLLFMNSRKKAKLNIDEIIEQTNQLSLDQKDEKIVILERIPSWQENQNGLETVTKCLIQAKREQFVEKLRKESRENKFSENRKKVQFVFNQMVIQLQQQQNLLTCITDKQEYEQEEDYYVMKKVPREIVNKQTTKLQMDAKQIEKYFDNYYVESDHEKKLSDHDSEDSQRTDQDSYDYPDDEDSHSNVEEEEDYDYDDNSSEEGYKKYQRKDIQENNDEIEMDDEQPPPINQSAAFMKFIKQHENLEKQKKDWKTFNYENDF